jgi:hypothetical protein
MPTGVRLQLHHVFSNQKNIFDHLVPYLFPMPSGVCTIVFLLYWSCVKALSNCQVVVQTPETHAVTGVTRQDSKQQSVSRDRGVDLAGGADLDGGVDLDGGAERGQDVGTGTVVNIKAGYG